MTFQRSATGTGPWSTLCTDNQRAVHLQLEHQRRLDSQRWYVRAVRRPSAAVDLRRASSSTIVDNEDPDVALTVPAAPLLRHRLADRHRRRHRLERRRRELGHRQRALRVPPRSARPTWASCGTDNLSPYACSLDTRPLTTGNYEFRATGDRRRRQHHHDHDAAPQVDNTPEGHDHRARGRPARQSSRARPSRSPRRLVAAPASRRCRSSTTPDRGADGVDQRSAPTHSAPYTCNWNTAGRRAGGTHQPACRDDPRPDGGTTVTSSSRSRSPSSSCAATDVQATNSGNPGRPDSRRHDHPDLLDDGQPEHDPAGLERQQHHDLGDHRATTSGSPDPTTDYLTVPRHQPRHGHVRPGLRRRRRTRHSSAARPSSRRPRPVSGRTVTEVTITLRLGHRRLVVPEPRTPDGAMRWTPSASVTDTFGNACADHCCSGIGEPPMSTCELLSPVEIEGGNYAPNHGTSSGRRGRGGHRVPPCPHAGARGIHRHLGGGRRGRPRPPPERRRRTW